MAIEETASVWYPARMPLTSEALEEQRERLVVDGALDLFEQLTPAERDQFLRALSSDESGPMADANLRSAVYAVDYRHVPVPPEVFFTHPDYLGHAGAELWPEWWPYLLYASDPMNRVYEVALTGAIGLGKTFVAQLILAYRLYRTLCLRDAARHYGLAAKSKIVFGLYSLTLAQVQDVGYYTLRDQLIGSSPFFQECVTPRRVSDQDMEFPGNVWIVTGSDALHVIGKNLFAICVAGSTLVATPDGEFVPITDLVTRPRSVLCYDASAERVVASAGPVRAVQSGTKVVYEMRLDSGQALRLTEDHRFLVRDAGGQLCWRNVRTVQALDDVMVADVL